MPYDYCYSIFKTPKSLSTLRMPISVACMLIFQFQIKNILDHYIIINFKSWHKLNIVKYGKSVIPIPIHVWNCDLELFNGI